MSKWKNYGLWVSIFSLVPILLDSLKIYHINIPLPSNYDGLIKAILGILVLAGIISNPTDGIWYVDKSQKSDQ